MKKTILCKAIAMALISAPAFAAEQTDDIVVLGEAMSQELPFSAIPFNSDSVSTGITTGDALRNIPGVSGSRMGGHGIDPSIRGQIGNRLNVLLDGAFVHGGCPNRMDPPTAYAPMDSYDQITVIRGVQTLEHGGGGSGGTVLFERNTEPFSDGEGIRFKGGLGFKSNSDTGHANVDISGGNSNGYLRLLAGISEGEDYEDGSGREVRAAYESTNATLIAGLTPDNNSLYQLSYEITQEDDVLFAGAGMDSPKSDNDTVRLKINKQNLDGLFSSFKAELGYSEVDHLMDNYTLRPLTVAMAMYNTVSSDTLTGRISGRINTERGHWNIGLDHQGNDRNSEIRNRTDIDQWFMWPGVENRQTGLFTEYNHIFDGNNRVTAGLRYDYVTARATKADEAPNGLAARTPNTLYNANYGITASTQTERNIGGLLRWEHDFSNGHTLYGTLSRSVRTADASERFVAVSMPTNAWIGNPEIDPEKHHQLEIGYIGKSNNGLKFEGSLFYNDVEDFIYKVGAGTAADPVLYRNINATLYGGEFTIAKSWGNWSADASIAYTHGENDSNNRALPQIAPLEGVFSLAYNAGNWDLGGRIRAADDQNRIDLLGDDVVATDGWAVVDLYGSATITKATKVRFGIDNVFDETYAQHLNRASSFDASVTQVNEPGMSAWVNLVIETH